MVNCKRSRTRPDIGQACQHTAPAFSTRIKHSSLAVWKRRRLCVGLGLIDLAPPVGRAHGVPLRVRYLEPRQMQYPSHCHACAKSIILLCAALKLLHMATVLDRQSGQLATFSLPDKWVKTTQRLVSGV